MLVTPCLTIDSIAETGSNRSTSSTDAPAVSDTPSTTFSPKMWNIGSTANTTSFAGPREEPFFVDLHVFDLLGVGGAKTTDAALVTAVALARRLKLPPILGYLFVGMALGQLVGGPVSDARGRRTPLLVSLGVLTLASIACAFSPSIGWMMAARLVQGFSGGWAMVIARSIVVDVAEGAGLVRSLNLVAGVGGLFFSAAYLLLVYVLQIRPVLDILAPFARRLPVLRSL